MNLDLNPSWMDTPVRVWTADKAAIQWLNAEFYKKTSAYLKSIQLIVSTICPESIVWIHFYQVILNGTSHYKRK